jgi:hypothetical protein
VQYGHGLARSTHPEAPKDADDDARWDDQQKDDPY